MANFTRSIDESAPSGRLVDASELDTVIQQLKVDIRERIQVEHEFPLEQTGEVRHKVYVGGAKGELIYCDAADSWGRLASGESGKVLQTKGANTPEWVGGFVRLAEWTNFDLVIDIPEDYSTIMICGRGRMSMHAVGDCIGIKLQESSYAPAYKNRIDIYYEAGSPYANNAGNRAQLDVVRALTTAETYFSFTCFLNTVDVGVGRWTPYSAHAGFYDKTPHYGYQNSGGIYMLDAACITKFQIQVPVGVVIGQEYFEAFVARR